MFRRHSGCTKLWNRFRPASILMVAVRFFVFFLASKNASTSRWFNFVGRTCRLLDLCRSWILIGSASSNSGDSEPLQNLFFMTAEAVTSTQLVSSFYLKLAGSFQLLDYPSLSKNHLHPPPPRCVSWACDQIERVPLKKAADIMLRFDISLERL